MKHRIGMLFLVILAFFAYMIWYLINVQNICNRKVMAIEESLMELSEPGAAIALLSVFAAVLLAVSGFRYLHSKTETDFYHSLPVKRRTLLYVTVTNDLFAFLACLALLIIFKCAVVAAVGHFNARAGVNAVLSFICCALIYAMFYLLMVLAMILTGHTFVGVLSFGVLQGYAPLVLRGLYPALASVFFRTYYADAAWGRGFYYFSPTSLSVILLSDAPDWTWKNHFVVFAAIVLWILGLAVLDYVLFERRASEMAGKALAFPKMAPVVRILLVIPIAIYTGLYLYSASFGASRLWIIAGIIIGGFLSHGIIECIYRFDVKGLLSCKRQMAACIGAALAVTGIFWADLTGFDAFVPGKEEAASVLVEEGYVSDDDFWGEKRKGISGGEMEGVLEILADAAGQNDKNSEDYRSEEEDRSDYTYYTVRYRMKNGREKVRMYGLDEELKDRLLGELFGIQKYREDRYPLYTADWSRVTAAEVFDVCGGKKLGMTEGQRKELFQTFLEELSGLTYEEAKTTPPIGRLDISYQAGSAPNRSDYFNPFPVTADRREAVDSYYIYPSFEKTIRYLKEELNTDLRTSLEDVKINKLSFWRYKDGDEDVYNVTDQEFIKSIQGSLVSSELLEGNLCYYSLDDSGFGITADLVSDEGEREVAFYTDEETGKRIENYLETDDE